MLSVALTRAVGLCDPGIRKVCLAAGRELREAAYFAHFNGMTAPLIIIKYCYCKP